MKVEGSPWGYLQDVLTAADFAALLHALNRASRSLGDDVFSQLPSLAPRIEALLPQFNSMQLAQVLSACSKTFSASHSLAKAARLRISRLLAAGEFQQPFEVAMILSASVKMRLGDPVLLRELAVHVQRLMQRMPHFPVRDLAVVTHAFASASFLEADLFISAADAALKGGLEEATTLDLARLLQAFATAAAHCASWTADGDFPEGMDGMKSVRTAARAAAESKGITSPSSGSALGVSIDSKAAFAAAHRRLFKACLEVVAERVAFASPGELSVAAHAFGLALVDSHGTDSKALVAVLQHIRNVAISSLTLFLPQQLASLLHTFARWRLPFPPCDVIKVLERLTQLSTTRGQIAVHPTSGQCAAAGELAWHPVFSPMSPASPLDTATRLSCLHSLGVLLRPFASAIASCNEAGDPPLRQNCTPDEQPLSIKDTSYGRMQDSTLAKNRCSEKPPAQPKVGAAQAASEAVAAGERLFQNWIQAVFAELSVCCFRAQETGIKMPETGVAPTMGIQTVVRLAEALANCTFTSTKRFVLPLQQLVLQRHSFLDAPNASKLLNCFKILGVPEDHDILLLLQERAEQPPEAYSTAWRSRDRAQQDGTQSQPLTIYGHPVASSTSAMPNGSKKL
ncbi:uncharacterized protein LOC34622962 [Cyclospora cayetanensis]|uniref:Uncharacterized protein LOC34622962 n=1 Tax=Cyclospora cayetanensis TaxID=88456 RepID=A0A6P6RYE3_9EIME|nr:uncharacterized protein LOC34622962 [Cyclospora cayetanensis]